MTVSTEVDHNDYTGNGVTTSFPYTFRIFQKTDLMVQVVDLSENITVLTLDTDYSVTGAGTYSGGSVVLSSPLANGWQISISRELPATQETDLRNQGKFFAEVHEDAFDKLTMLIQQCFSFLRLALRKPSFIANYYDALNNRIRNLRDPSQAQDAATKNYVDGQIIDNTNAWKAGDAVLDQKIDANFRRSLRIPESYVPEYFVKSIRSNMLVGCNDQGNFVPIAGQTDTADLAIKLASLGGSSLIGGLGFLTPEMFGAKRDGVSDDSEAVLLAIERASIGPTKIIWVGGGKYLCDPVNFNIPSGVSIIGGGEGSGFIFPTPPSSAMHEFFTLAGNGSLLKDFSIQFNTGGLGSIGAVQAYGVWFKDTATNCRAEGLTIDGKYTDTVMGFSNGFRLTGNDNTIRNCIVTHCSMGATVRGTRLSILDSYFDNGYTTEDGTAWTQSKPRWDGIACEGILDCLISRNTCTNNGQSGIYIGGGGAGYSSGNIVTNNRCFHNWNRGIDTGISGTQSDANNVTNITISGNDIRDNRETQLWLYGTNNSRVIGNSIIETAEYDSLFGAQASSSRAGLALGQSAWCVNNIIDDNDIQMRSSTPFGVVFNGLGHLIAQTNRIGGRATNYWFGSPVNMAYGNKVEYFKATFSPVLRAGANNVTLTSGTASYTIRGNEVEYDISLLLSGSGGTGNLYIGTLPATVGVILDAQEVNVSYWTGLNWLLIPGSLLQSYFLSDDPSQIAVVRKYGSDTINDIPSCIGSGTRLRIKARAIVNVNTKTDSAIGISFFGHSFLSEQGFANGVAESLGKRAYNFARGGSSSTEAALVFGAIQHSYMPVGGVIPASGSVDLSPNEDAVWYAGSSIATVTLAGVQGIISSVNVSGITNKLIFTRSSAGDPVSVPSPVPMTVLPWVRQNSWSTKSLTEHSTFKNDIVIIQCMRNNASWATGLTDIASIVSSLGTNKFVILPEFPYETETTGTPGATTVNSYNAQLKATYPNNYCEISGVDMLQNFKNNANPNYPSDVTDVSNGVTPRSLRYDSLHPSRYRQENALRSGVQVNSEFVARFIKSKGW